MSPTIRAEWRYAALDDSTGSIRTRYLGLDDVHATCTAD